MNKQQLDSQKSQLRLALIARNTVRNATQLSDLDDNVEW